MSNPYESPQTQAQNVRADYRANDWHAQTRLNPSDASLAVQDFFIAKGYRLEAGEQHNAVYGIGNTMTWIMFGGFAKRYKFKVQVVPAGSGSNVKVVKGMSGMLGGVLGYSKMKNELARVRKALEKALR